jgi:hypothetical protein
MNLFLPIPKIFLPLKGKVYTVNPPIGGLIRFLFWTADENW